MDLVTYDYFDEFYKEIYDTARVKNILIEENQF